MTAAVQNLAAVGRGHVGAKRLGVRLFSAALAQPALPFPTSTIARKKVEDYDWIELEGMGLLRILGGTLGFLLAVATAWLAIQIFRVGILPEILRPAHEPTAFEVLCIGPVSLTG